MVDGGGLENRCTRKGTGGSNPSPSESWLAALEARHLANLTPTEVARALRALSSCYVERRAKLASGGALDSAGKRAAFALFYAPVHFVVVRNIVRSLSPAATPRARIIDLGCGTGSAGAAWALEAGHSRITGFDRNPWAVAEANWTYRQLGLEGGASQQEISRISLKGSPDTGVLAGYVVNELADDARAALLPRLLQLRGRGTQVLVVEPIARRLTQWWSEWQQRFEAAGGRFDEWRFAADLPNRQRDLARAAGLDPRELTARTLFLA